MTAAFSQAALDMHARVLAVSQTSGQCEFRDVGHAARVTRLLGAIRRLIHAKRNLIVLQGDDGAEALYPSEGMMDLMDRLEAELRARPAEPPPEPLGVA